MDTDGGNLIPVTTGNITTLDPSRFPDGKRIAFRAYESVGYQIYIMKGDSTNQKKVSSNRCSHFTEYA
jgi:Tol biopolymer transport system component